MSHATYSGAGDGGSSLDFATLRSAQGGITVNGQPAQTYGDFTFASTNNLLISGQNTFTTIARNIYGQTTNNVTTAYLPSSISLAFDANGNLSNGGTRSFVYDAENRLVTNWVAGAWKSEFVYDGLGRRRIGRDYGWQGGQWVKTNETRYLCDGFLVLQERDSNNMPRVTYTRGLDLSGTLQYADGIGGLLARTDGAGSTFYHADGAGNITGLMDGNENMAARYLYGAFGKLTAQWGSLASANVMQFSSMPRHANSGLSLYPFRGFDPTLQRWIARDPVGETGGINLYGFVGNSPLVSVDPYGEDLHLATAKGPLQVPGPLGYAWGDTTLQNLAAGTYNTVPLVGNYVIGVGNSLMEGLGTVDRATLDLLTALFGGDQQLGQAANNVLAVSPLGLAEDISKLGKLGKVAQEPAKALQVTRGAIKCKNGTKVTGFTSHGVDRAIGNAAERAGTTPEAILDALKNPQKILSGVDSQGRPYQIFTGQNARVVVNPQTGNVVSVNPLSGAGAH